MAPASRRHFLILYAPQNRWPAAGASIHRSLFPAEAVRCIFPVNLEIGVEILARALEGW